MSTARTVTQIPNDFKELLPTRRGSRNYGAPREVAMGVYVKTSKNKPGNGKDGSRVAFTIAGNTLAKLRWRAKDKVKVTQSVSNRRLLMLSLAKSTDTAGVATLCHNDSKNPDRGLKTSIATTTFAVTGATFVPITDAEVVRAEKDVLVIAVPLAIWPAIGA